MIDSKPPSYLYADKWITVVGLIENRIAPYALSDPALSFCPGYDQRTVQRFLNVTWPDTDVFMTQWMTNASEWRC
jgi:hypothetical protein